MIVIAGAGWGLYELFRRFNLIESFSTYGPASEEIAD